MADEQKFSVLLTGPQMDFIGGLVVSTLNAATAQAKLAQGVYELLRTSVAAAQKPASLQVVEQQASGTDG